MFVGHEQRFSQVIYMRRSPSSHEMMTAQTKLWPNVMVSATPAISKSRLIAGRISRTSAATSVSAWRICDRWGFRFERP